MKKKNNVKEISDNCVSYVMYGIFIRRKIILKQTIHRQSLPVDSSFM